MKQNCCSHHKDNIWQLIYHLIFRARFSSYLCNKHSKYNHFWLRMYRQIPRQWHPRKKWVDPSCWLRSSNFWKMRCLPLSCQPYLVYQDWDSLLLRHPIRDKEKIFKKIHSNFFFVHVHTLYVALYNFF